MIVRFPRLSRSGQDDHSGTYPKLIGATFTTETIRAVVFMVLVNYGRPSGWRRFYSKKLFQGLIAGPTKVGEGEEKGAATHARGA